MKLSVLTGFVFLAAATIAVLGGFIDPLETEKKNKESDLFDSFGNTQKSGSANRFPGGIVEGKVIAVNSGYILTLLDASNRELQVKLAGIQAPDVEQEFGQQSKEYLESLVLNRKISVTLQKIEESGILVGKVLLEDKNISLEQIKAGLAVIDENVLDQQMDYDRHMYVGAEKEARTAGVGLWVNSKTNNTEVSPVSAQNTAAENPVSETKTGDYSEGKNNPTPSLKNETPIPQTEVEIPTGFSSVTPVPVPTSTVAQPVKNETPAVKDNAEIKTSTKAASATARCSDGTLSYSASRSGACSNHGGVSAWLGDSNPTPIKTTEKTYLRGSRGGCYYINANGKKTYVDQSLCK